MALYPPAEYGSTATSLPFAAGSPRIRPVTYDSIRGDLIHMLAELEAQGGVIAALPAEVKSQFEARAVELHTQIASLLQQLEENKGGDIRTLMSFDAARGKLQSALVNFYEAMSGGDGNIALQGLGDTTDRNKYLWWAGGCAVLALGAVGIALMMNKPKRGKKSSLGFLNAKFKRVIPAK